ncbi:MAG TPA: hypothetical protein VGP48_10575 [Stellaceae bacterium]|jgi:hypothetical protein|nr:hypothetical protein [Stellaceae bacterium]
MMNRTKVLLLCCAVIGLAGCAINLGNREGGGSQSRGIAEDVSSTRDAGPTSGNLATPMMQ